MNILFLTDVIWTNSKNGGVQSLCLLLKELSKKHDVTLYTFDKFIKQNDFPSINIKKFKLPSLLINNKYLSFIVNNIFILYLNFRYIFEGLRIKDKPDLLYCSGSLPIISCIILKLLYKPKVVHRIYGTFLKVNNSFIEILKKIYEVLLFKSKANKYIITDDGSSGKAVAKSLGLSDEKIVFLRNGVDKIDTSSRSTYRKDLIKSLFGGKRKITVCLSTCRLSRWKRVDRLIAAFNEIKNKDLFLLIVGDGPEKKKLEQLSRNSNIIFLGGKANQEILKYLIASDIYICAYDVTNIGNSLLESLAAGLPVITIDTGETRKVINKKNNNGILIEKFNEKNCAQKIKKSILELSQSKILREKFSRGSKEYAEKNFKTWNERIALEVDLLESL